MSIGYFFFFFFNWTINPAASLWYFSNSALFATRSLKQGPFLLHPPGRRWWRGSKTVLSRPIWSPPTWGTQTKACSPPTRWESCCGGTKTACSKPSRLYGLSWMMFSDSSIRSHLSIWIRYCCTDWTVLMKMCDRCQLQRYIRIIENKEFLIKVLFFSQSNASNDGEYVFFTGQQNYKDFARVDTWKGER